MQQSPASVIFDSRLYGGNCSHGSPEEVVQFPINIGSQSYMMIFYLKDNSISYHNMVLF